MKDKSGKKMAVRKGDIITPLHPFEPRLGIHRVSRDENHKKLVLCEFYLQSCLVCGYHFGKRVNRITCTKEDILVCPKCNTPRELCNQIAYSKTYTLNEDRTLIVKGIPRCVFHGGKTGDFWGERVSLFSAWLSEAESQAFNILMNSKQEGLEKELSNFLIAKLESIWNKEDNNLSDREKLKETHAIIDSVTKLVKTFTSIEVEKGSSFEVKREQIISFLNARVLEGKKESYRELLQVILPVLAKSFGTTNIQIVLNELPRPLREIAEDVKIQILENNEKEGEEKKMIGDGKGEEQEIIYDSEE